MINHTKEAITKTVLSQLEDDEWTIETAMTKWWMSPRNSEGLRLTYTGDSIFQSIELEYYKFPLTLIPDASWYGSMLELRNKIKCPYYLNVEKGEGGKGSPYIKIYDHKIAMMINLYGGIADYLKSVKVKK